jgi:hypothetical protein
LPAVKGAQVPGGEVAAVAAGDVKEVLTGVRPTQSLPTIRQEAGPLAVILPTAFLHELPVEADGTGPAREILQRLGARPELIAEVCDALDRLQRPPAADDPPSVNVLRDAHRLDELEERRKAGATAGLDVGENAFQTDSGRRMAREMPRPERG